MSFQSAYPNATNVSWQPVNEWWLANYTENNRLMHYGPNGTSYSVALPAIENKTPEDVATKVIGQFGHP